MGSTPRRRRLSGKTPSEALSPERSVPVVKFPEVWSSETAAAAAAAAATEEESPSKKLRCNLHGAADNPYACLLKNAASVDFLSQQPHNSAMWIRAFSEAGGAGTGKQSMVMAIKRLRKLIWFQTRRLALVGNSVPVAQPAPRTKMLRASKVTVSAPCRLCKVDVLEKDMLEVALEYLVQGHKVAVLNMANETSPGGGVHTGAGSQEEDLHRRSDCFRFLQEQRKALYPIPRDACLLSEQVTVLRGTEKDGYPLLEKPFRIAVMSCAPIDRPKLSGMDYAMASDRALMKTKIETILAGASQLGCDVAILGAFGCGAFGNPPNAVAEIFREALDRAQLRQAVFCIYDDHNTGSKHNPHGNFKLFSEIMHKQGRSDTKKRSFAAGMQLGSMPSPSSFPSSSSRRRLQDTMPSVEVWAAENFPGSIQGEVSGIDFQQVLPEAGVVSLGDVSWLPSNKGFQNHGNDCWMISCIQFLSSAPRLRELVHRCAPARPDLLEAITAIRADFHSASDSHVTACQCARRRSVFGFRDSRYAAQEDAQEGVVRLLDALDSRPPRPAVAGSSLLPPRRSEIFDIFGICIETQRGCFGCKVVKHDWAEQLFCMVPTPPPPSRHTTTAIWADNYGSIELLSDAECEYCSSRGHSCRRESVRRIGEILVLNLGVYDMEDPHLPKLHNVRIVASPEIVVRSQQAASFELIAAIEHYGSSLRGGHYIAYRREANGMWRVLNDDGNTLSEPLKHGDLINQAQLDRRQLYLCMYARRRLLPSSSSCSAPQALERSSSPADDRLIESLPSSASSGHSAGHVRTLD